MKSDWTISGSGGLAVIEDAGSKRLQLTGSKLILYNGRNDLLNAEIIAEIKLGNYTTNNNAGIVHRCDALSNNCYYFCVQGNNVYYRRYFIYRIISGVATQIAYAPSDQRYEYYIKTRFRIDGNQLSIEEFVEGNWNLILAVEDTFITVAGYSGLKATNGSTSYWMLFDNLQIGEKA